MKNVADYFGRLANAVIFRWFLAACFQTVGRQTHARHHGLQVALAAGSRPSASDLAAFNRALEGELPARAKGREKDFSPLSSGTPYTLGSPGEALKNLRGI